MIVFSIFSLGAVAYRLRKGLFNRIEGALLAVALGSFLVITLQRCLEHGHLRLAMPEWRYVAQASVLLYGWGVWGLLQLPMRLRCFVLPALVALLATYHTVMIAKAHVPFGRRAAFVQASEWAIEKIRADYRGPMQDDKKVFSIKEYHRPRRPIVHGHNPRIGYLLGGRDESLTIFGAADRPDYWVTGHHDELFVRDDYDLMDTFVFGKRRFELLRHKRKTIEYLP